MDKCAPGRKYNNNSCFTVANLITIANQYNKLQKNSKNVIEIKEDKRYLLKELTSRMKNDYNCDNQQCWMDTNVIKTLNDSEIKQYTFRPKGPARKTEWMDTNKINNVMNQYEKKYNDFVFLGAVPADFDEMPSLPTYSLNFGNLVNNNKSKLGMVINLDTHNQPGSHWVALYSDLIKNQIYYFDSIGKKPTKRTTRFVGKLLNFLHNKKYNTKLTSKQFLSKYNSIDYKDEYDIRYNKIQHQFKNSECGVYSMNFIIRLLNGKSFDDIVNNITNDDDMNNCRKVYFRN
jgi:hypothetical protein